MFKRVLVANRGEIACRIQKTCHRLGIQTIAVGSTADQGALHMKLADKAVVIGPPEASGSYLNAAAILEVAKQYGADAIHPGYGFLSENATFARKVKAAGIIFIGPSPEAIEAMGDKPLEAAATLRASPLDAFFTVALPLARPGYLTATVMGFAHTVGEFGVVLMLGGNIPGVTRVVSVQIYDHVEALEYAQAHWLAGGMVLFSFVVLLALHWRQPRGTRL